MCTPEEYAEKFGRLEARISSLQDGLIRIEGLLTASNERHSASVEQSTETKVALAHLEERVDTLNRIVWGVGAAATTALAAAAIEGLFLLQRLGNN